MKSTIKNIFLLNGSFGTSVLLLAALFSTAIIEAASSTTQYVCNNGSYCTLKSNGGMCSPTGVGPNGMTFNPTVQGEQATQRVPFECIGISSSDLVSGGGNCVMSCPDDCFVITDVSDPCGTTGTTGESPSSGQVSALASTTVGFVFAAAFLAN